MLQGGYFELPHDPLSSICIFKLEFYGRENVLYELCADLSSYAHFVLVCSLSIYKFAYIKLKYESFSLYKKLLMFLKKWFL